MIAEQIEEIIEEIVDYLIFDYQKLSTRDQNEACKFWTGLEEFHVEQYDR